MCETPQIVAKLADCLSVDGAREEKGMGEVGPGEEDGILGDQGMTIG